MAIPSQKTKASPRSLFRRTLRIFLWLFIGACLLVFSVFAVFNWIFLPHIDSYRPKLERMLSQNTGYQVKIKSLSARWIGLAPELNLGGITLSAGNEQALSLQKVTLKPSWLSVPSFTPIFEHIRIDSPVLALRRDKQKKLYLNGLPLLTSGKQKSGDKLDSWLLSQEHVVIEHAQISWQDDYLQQNLITLKNASLQLSHLPFSEHHLNLHIDEITNSARGIALNIIWQGNKINKWREWNGNVSLSLQQIQNANWSQYLKPWVNVISGSGQLAFNMSFKNMQILAMNGHAKLINLQFIPQKTPELILPLINAKFVFQRKDKNLLQLNVTNLSLSTNTGVVLQNANFSGEYSADKTNQLGNISLNQINLDALQPLLEVIDSRQKTTFAKLQPRGVISALSSNWNGKIKAPQNYNFTAQFNNLSLKNINKKVYGFSGVSGKINLSNIDGSLLLDSKNILLKTSLFKAPLALDELNGQVNWKLLENKQIDVNISKLSLANSDLSAQLSGTYKSQQNSSGYADITGNLQRVKAVSVQSYLPNDLEKDVKLWLTQAFIGGQVKTANLVLRGDLDKFPFRGGKGGQFKVDAQLDNVDLHYSPGWPRINNINGRMQFINQSMLIQAQSGMATGVALHDVKVSIPDLDTSNPLLLVDGKAAGSLAKMLDFPTKMPIGRDFNEFFRGLKGTGSAKLALNLRIPLMHSKDSKVSGDVSLAGNTLRFSKLPIPIAKQIAGTLHFNEHGITANNLGLTAFGGRFKLSAFLDPKQRFEIEGSAESKLIAAQYLAEIAPYISGSSYYKVQIVAGRDLELLSVSSNLQGTKSSAPAPLNKYGNSIGLFQLTLKPTQQGMNCSYSIGRRSSGEFNLKKDGKFINGIINIGTDLSEKPQAQSLTINLNAPLINVDNWADIFVAKSGKTKTMPNLPISLRLKLNSAKVTGFEHELNYVHASFNNNVANGAWSGGIDSKEINGKVNYSASGALRVRLQKFDIDMLITSKKKGAQEPPAMVGTSSNIFLPNLDVVVDKLRYKNNELGRFALTGKLVGNVWKIADLSLVNADGQLSGSLRANRGNAPYVESEFSINSKNIGNLLGRFGLKGAMLNGNGKLQGKLNWQGKVLDFDESRLNGSLELEMSDGRFLQVEPGAARLLGILSLQSLTRRARLNFSDVFGKGFSFDKISASAKATNGVFTTDNLLISGSSAEVSITGSANLKQNTQQLHAKILPRISGSVALTAGAATLNPFVGLGVFAAQKILRDPFSSALSVDYEISGTFADPIVKKITSQPVQNKTDFWNKER